MPFTTIAEFTATETPTDAELALIAACRAGTHLTLPIGVTEATLPPEGQATPDRAIRAKLLRLLIIGGSPECGLHPLGIWLEGAQITEILNLQFTKTRGRLMLNKCRFSAAPQLDQAEIAQLNLNYCHLPGLSARGIVVVGDIFLRNLTATGTVDVAGAKIGGQLDCVGATLNGAGGKALNAQRMQVTDSMFLISVIATGTVDVTGAKIGGQLSCRGATLNGAGGKALFAQRLHVAQGFFFQRLKSVTGQVFLNATHVGDLVDDAASWRLAEKSPSLNGFTYDRIGGPAPLTLAARQDWLARGSRYNGNFHPHPYTQFARVLREMGHAAEARKVLMERDRLLFAESHAANLATLNAARTENKGDMGKEYLRYYLTRFWSWFSFYASGYGHAPQRALFVSLACIGIGALLFFAAWQAGVMVPNSAIILTSPDWLNAMTTNPNAPSAAWTQLAPGKHFETFYCLPYALDVFVPFVSLGQENAWAATTTNGFGKFIRWFTFAYQIIGWAITALGIAAITGFVQKNQPD